MKVLAFDANSIVNRAFYGVRLLSTREGTYTNAVYGFFNIVYKLIEEQKPDAVAFAFDLHAPTFRHKMYEPYKGTRKGMPEELRQQMPLVKEMLRFYDQTRPYYKKVPPVRRFSYTQTPK